MGTKCIVGGDIYTPLETIPRGTILIEDNLIEAIGSSEEIALPEGSHVVDASGCRVVPGLIDLHLHGLGGKEVTDADADDIPRLLAQHGVTSFQATVPAAPLDEMARAVKNALHLVGATDGRPAMGPSGQYPTKTFIAPPAGARLVGIHLEGPFLSTRQPGALDPGHFRVPDVEEMAGLALAGEGLVRVVTLAPELNGALDLIAWLKDKGIVAAIGHSDAGYVEVAMAIEAGLSYATHCFNAMRGFHHRAPGAVGAILTNDAIAAEVIGDGVHAHPAAVSLLVRAKGCEKVCLVSDAAPVAGLAEGTYHWLGREARVDPTSARLADGTLAGATLLLNQQLTLLERSLSLPYNKILAMATSSPAAVIGIESGRLAVGRRADIAVFDSQHRCRLTMIDGEIVYAV